MDYLSPPRRLPRVVSENDLQPKLRAADQEETQVVRVVLQVEVEGHQITKKASKPLLSTMSLSMVMVADRTTNSQWT